MGAEEGIDLDHDGVINIGDPMDPDDPSRAGGKIGDKILVSRWIHAPSTGWMRIPKGQIGEDGPETLDWPGEKKMINIGEPMDRDDP
ncbi:MAG: hypothetical protein CM15mP89_4570 [Gammaproteobacteria bacterium]|nr:MAG: hypothetical protein CM15mP89_4570 [Gammaproteobacteria bacterium]